MGKSLWSFCLSRSKLSMCSDIHGYSLSENSIMCCKVWEIQYHNLIILNNYCCSILLCFLLCPISKLNFYHSIFIGKYLFRALGSICGFRHVQKSWIRRICYTGLWKHSYATCLDTGLAAIILMAELSIFDRDCGAQS